MGGRKVVRKIRKAGSASGKADAPAKKVLKKHKIKKTKKISGQSRSVSLLKTSGRTHGKKKKKTQSVKPSGYSKTRKPALRKKHVKASSEKITDPVAKDAGQLSKIPSSSQDKASEDINQTQKDRITTRIEPKRRQIDKYNFNSSNMPITVTVYIVEGEFVPIYVVSIASISRTTEMILEQIRKKLIREVNLGIADITSAKNTDIIEDKFKDTIGVMIQKYFPDVDDSTKSYLTTYLIQKSLGLGHIEILMNDNLVEEIVINQGDQPVWVYHKKHGWVKTNIRLTGEEQSKHYATMIGRRVGRQISVLEPLLDAHLNEGDRVNATLMPISTAGNTITIRRFSREPFTITHFLEYRTLNLEAAATIWLAMQFEMSAIIAGGTASGKTSTMNVLATFFPPNQRILSIEDTREIRLPKFLHWVPLNTRPPNAEGMGEVSMEDLLVNALRMRPDRILVGEVRRSREAQTLFEAIHTGHSCYATFHANNVDETINRLCHPPINVPETMLPAISLVIVQFRNRRTGHRRTFQIAEILEDSTPNVLLQYDVKKDTLVKVNESKSLFKNLSLYTGMTDSEIKDNIKEKVEVLKYLLRNKIKTVDGVGRVMAEYYTDKKGLMRAVRKNKILK